ncbi:MAG: hypothetical protein FJ217_15885 [Ignavibacteria bacterium]|nr:hypothetical protein [Ignavibacteria bacterium]
MKALFCLLTLSAAVFNPIPAQINDTTGQFSRIRIGAVVPLIRYVQLTTRDRVIEPGNPIALSPEEISVLRVVFLRDSLSDQDGPQFLKITTISTNRRENLIDENVQYAISFRPMADEDADLRELERCARQVAPLAYVNPELMRSVRIQLDSLGEWGHVIVRVEPEEELVKYYGRIKEKLEYHILVKGRLLEFGFTLSVPKVLYDTRTVDSVLYGNTSAMLRIHLLNGETGVRYPISVGVGTFGVDSPIDVSRSGGGFAISLYFDIIQLLRIVNINLPQSVNAGFDVSPFFPIGHKGRLLFNARIGITP